MFYLHLFGLFIYSVLNYYIVKYIWHFNKVIYSLIVI